MRDYIIDPDSLCLCGSGKKYRFCCQRMAKDVRALKATLAPKALADLEESESLQAKGMRCMDQGQYEQAIIYFTKALEASRLIGIPANNLALCLFVTGKLEEAVQVQRQSLKDSPLPNPFGLANLSMFLLCLGDEEGAAEAVSAATKLEAPNSYAVVKVCESLARFKRHRDILEVADASDFASDPLVCFYTGVAAANLGDCKRAMRDLRCVPIGNPKRKMAKKYFRHLKNKTQPDTIRKDWPYLLPEEYYISSLSKGDEASQKALMSCRHVVDFVEAMLNQRPEKKTTKTVMQMLEACQHPEATALLWLIVKGTFGSDEIRAEAAVVLMQKGEIQPGDQVKFLTSGENTEHEMVQVALNPEFKFSELPPELDKSYRELILAAHENFPDWPKIISAYEKLMPKAPQYYPFRYNYAVALYYSNQHEEAESIFRSLIAEYPEYLFPRSTLLIHLLGTDRLDDAKQLVSETKIPKETHPDALVAWLVALTMYCEADGMNAAAYRTLKMARKIAPKNSSVVSLWWRWEDYDEKKDTSLYLRLKRRLGKK